jgi:hypothetical protein
MRLGSIAVGVCGASCWLKVVKSLISLLILAASTVIAGFDFAIVVVTVIMAILRDNIIGLIGMFFIVLFLNVSLCSTHKKIIVVRSAYRHDVIVSFAIKKGK